MFYTKKPIAVEAVQIMVPVAIETLEGIMRGVPGDYLIIGVKNEPYICAKSIFEETYRPLALNEEADQSLSMEARIRAYGRNPEIDKLLFRARGIFEPTEDGQILPASAFSVNAEELKKPADESHSSDSLAII